MNWFQALIVGLVQGLTEFIPVSSTAHVRIIPSLLGWQDPGAAVTAVTQLGTLVAVVVFFRSDIASLTIATWSSVSDFRNRASWSDELRHRIKLAWFIALGTVPIGIFGLLFKHPIETQMRSLTIIGFSLVGLALLLAVAEYAARHVRTIRDMKFFDTQIIGVAQAVALIPGASRSGVTITAGLFIGLTRESAARFSFLLSIPAVLASGLLELKDLLEMGLAGESLVSLILATITAAVSGYATIAFLLRWLQTRSTFIFIVYRIALGCLILWLSSQSLIH